MALISAAFFAGRSVVAKTAGTELTVPNLLMLQGFLALPALWLISRVQHVSIVPNLAYGRFYTFRVIFGLLNLLFLFLALTGLPTALASTLGFTSPIFLALLAPLLLKERARLAITLGIVAGFVGVTLNAGAYLGYARPVFVLIGLGAGFSHAVAQVYARKLGKVGEPGLRTVFWLNVGSAAVGTVWSALQGFEHLTLFKLVLAFDIAVMGGFGQVFSATAFRTGTAAVVNGLTFLIPPITAVFAFLFLHECPRPLSLLGMLLTLSACYYLVYIEQRRLRRLHERNFDVNAGAILEEHVQLQSNGFGIEPFYESGPTAAQVETERETRLSCPLPSDDEPGARR
jgi:drug/metabolite transporter (DMT)-like permease